MTDVATKNTPWWSKFWLFRLGHFAFIGVFWRYVGLPIWWLFRLGWRYSFMVVSLATANAVTYARNRIILMRDGYIPTDDHAGRLIDDRVGRYMEYRLIRYPLTFGSLIIGIPFVFFAQLLAGFGPIVAVWIVVDQMTHPNNPLPPQFEATVGNIAEARGREDRAILVTDALVYQLECELSSAIDQNMPGCTNVWGWTPNDLAGYGLFSLLFDNQQNRKLGVQYATFRMTDVWSRATTRLGAADRENPLLVRARTEGFSLSGRSWFLPSSESYYREGISLVRQYQAGLRARDPNFVVNVTTGNLVQVLEGMHSMLQEPHGRVLDRGTTVSWTELDDTIYYAQGAAIVARNMLAAMYVAYNSEFSRGDTERQMLDAIDTLSVAVEYNPWLVTRGDGDSMIADHRRKFGGYISEALRRIEDLTESLRN